VRCVPQISNLLYRRIAFGRAIDGPLGRRRLARFADYKSAIQQSAEVLSKL
jgi:phage FluMu protein gp41